MSVHAQDDTLLTEDQNLEQQETDPKPSDNTEFWTSLEAELQTTEPTAAKVDSHLADVANSHWGKTLPPQKLKSIFEKYHRPENCNKFCRTKVNAEAWQHLKWDKKQEDLRLANLQQTINKVITCPPLGPPVILAFTYFCNHSRQNMS